MAQARPSMQELIGRRKRAGFVGRRGELDLFRGNFDTSPEDERHSFVFHVHGTAGVGKSSLVRELEAVAAQRKALTACTDESVNSVPEAMAAISAQFARQGAELKALDKLLATYRQRRHEAETASVTLEAADADPGLPAPPSPGSMAVSQAGLVGLGMVPVVGAFAGAIDPAQVAHSTDRLRAALSARFRNHDDVRLVLEPLKVLTPVFVEELARVAADAPWVALFFDTYERTSPFLDPWLLDLITTDRYGALPANAVFTLAGQHGPDPARWADNAEFIAEFALEPFTDSEARQLLAAKGLVDETVVREVLRLSGGLPVLVSTLAENPGAVDDPTATAVERFLKWEHDPARRGVALLCALPRRLDEDVFRASVADGETEGLYEWLRGLPFVSERAGRVHFHDVVRTPMLRLQRTRSPRQWAERQARLAERFAGWRAEAEEGVKPGELWSDEPWRELRLEELYHLLCARPQGVIGEVLREVIGACRAGEAAIRGCVQVVVDVGEQTDTDVVRAWGRDLLEALSAETEALLGLLLDRAGLDAAGRAEAHCLRGQELRRKREHARALAEYDQAVALAPSADAYYGRALTRSRSGEYEAAAADYERAAELRPDSAEILFDRAETLRMARRHAEAVEIFDRALALDPAYAKGWASRASAKHAHGDTEGALADFGRALEIEGKYLWALVNRAKVYRDLGRPDDAFADLDRAVEIAPDSAWIASERGDAYRLAERYEQAAEELGRACELAPDHASAHAGRGFALDRLDRAEEAHAAYDRAVELEPDYMWALGNRGDLRRRTGDEDGAFEDLDRAVSVDGPRGWWALTMRGGAHAVVGRHEEAVADFDLARARKPDLGQAWDYWIWSMFALDRGEEAVVGLDRALDGDPDNGRLLEIRSRALSELGRYGEALRDLDRAIGLMPDAEWLYTNRARVCIALGRLDQALTDIQKDAASSGWARRVTVDVLLWQGRDDEAVRLVEGIREIAQQDSDHDAMFTCWFVDVMNGRWDLARQAVDWLRENHPAYEPLASALTVAATEGLLAAEPLWPKEGYPVPDQKGSTVGRILVGFARGTGAEGDMGLSRILSGDHNWEQLADAAIALTFLARCPDADPAFFGPRLARVIAARDAFQARYAE
ncbi:ATP-binding protein [Streptomyces sp. NBC_00140]|uniref:ATP-binding protein n=1 Tax=Streptomyces sp. NBC_00140 TaxID=2975664 RepID=UPI0022561DCD|nr:ATP-binding protein [Streptomyces sp. NBC_00140]MCX5333377.1 tetratricopeptide repeat protein [Streptomyces sp. NBC_00140]